MLELDVVALFNLGFFVNLMNNQPSCFCTVCKMELDVPALFNSAVTVIFSLKQGKWLAIGLI